MITSTEIERLILENLPGAQVRVSDMTGTGDHFEIEVVSAAFAGKPLIDQHKMLHAILEGKMGFGDIHAVKLRTRAPKA
jgi:stress-induced morphogen